MSQNLFLWLTCVIASFRKPSATLRSHAVGLYSESMNALDILFRSSRFNLLKTGEHFINPCCFGEDLAAWLRSKLAEKNIETAVPYQEDWGWELPATYGRDSYYVCMSGNADNSGSYDGEWRIIAEKRRSIWERLTGKGKIAADDALVTLIEQILSNETGIRNVHRGQSGVGC